MAHREIRIPHAEIKNSQTCTQVIEDHFRRRGVDVHRHEVDELVDDFDRKERVLKVQAPKTMVGFGRAG